MKKRIAMLCFLFSTVGLLFAGGTQESGEKEIKLTIAGRDGAYGEAMQMAADAYHEKHPEVSFEVLKLSGSSLFEKTVIDMRSETGTYDVILIDDPNATQFLEVNWLANLDELYKQAGVSIDSDFIEPTLRLGRYPYTANGTLYALPFAGNVELFAYRTDLFAKYGLQEPQTWSQVLTAVKTIDKNEPSLDGVVFRGVKGNPIVTGFLPIFWAFGGKILDADGNVTINSPEGLNALHYFLELSKYAPEGVSMYQSAQVKDAIYSGKAAIATEVWPGWIGDLENPEKSSVVGKVKVIKHPGEVEKSSPMIGVWLAGIPKASKHQQAAFDFLRFLTSYDMQVAMSDSVGLPPTRSEVYKLASQQAKYPWYPAQLDALRSGVARTRTTKWKEVEDQLGTVLQFALMGNISAEQALAEAEKGITNILK
ncbi:extracellular solute-binding protein [Sediminispirochaeta bajacaliforniensis]|uniref:extracellular solute-binding protein n=1 Tax=Sediminispirochaeta bajacaliforniensis TaxID=148 RepID=UPI00035F8520|nr:extracellular solute-binding protein [Sediminispirochaeta bajacaliforniensis]